MSNIMPPIGSRGLYSLSTPWSASPNTSYECAALRSFVDLENLGADVFKRYYQPKDLTEDDYRRDRDNDAVIVTLVSNDQAPIYVPSTYITSYPGQQYHNYQHVVLSASLGPLPDSIDLTFARDQVSTALAAVVGVSPTVNVNVAPLSDTVSPEQHAINENARAAAITNQTTDYARRLEAEAALDRATQRNAIYEDILRQNGLLPS